MQYVFCDISTRKGWRGASVVSTPSSHELPHGICCSPNDEPSGPEDHENHGVATATENEDGKLEEELPSEHLESLGAVDLGRGFCGGQVSVKGAELGGEVCLEGDDLAGVQGGSEGDAGEGVGLQAKEDGEGADDGLEIASVADGGAEDSDEVGMRVEGDDGLDLGGRDNGWSVHDGDAMRWLVEWLQLSTMDV